MAVDRALGPVVQADPLTPAESRDGLADLETSLAYTFKDLGNLALALTHIGATLHRTASYQRLEFLGDRVLGLAVAAMLYETFPEADEGELSRRLADLVRAESCAEVAAEWDVEPHIRLGPGERANLSLRRAVLGDICESIIGAVFLDGGYEHANALVRRAFADRMRAPRRLRDPKTALQEWAQAKGLAAPLYREVARKGPHHAPEFTVAVMVDGHEEAEAKGPSKRIAEQAAASAFIGREGMGEEADGA